MAPLSPPASDFRKKPLEDALRLLGLTFVVFPIGQILNTRRHTALENAAPRAHYARIVLLAYPTVHAPLDRPGENVLKFAPKRDQAGTNHKREQRPNHHENSHNQEKPERPAFAAGWKQCRKDCGCEPPRLSWRLHTLRGWSHEQHIKEVSS